MNKNQIFPVVYGIISAIISFIAVFFICMRSFHLNLQLAILLSGIFAVFFLSCPGFADMLVLKLNESFINII